MSKSRMTPMLLFFGALSFVTAILILARSLGTRAPAKSDCEYVEPVPPITVRIKLLESSDFGQHETDFVAVPEKYASLIFEMVSHPKQSNQAANDFQKLCVLEIKDPHSVITKLTGVWWATPDRFTFFTNDHCVFVRNGPHGELKTLYRVDEVPMLCAMVDDIRLFQEQGNPAHQKHAEWCYDQLYRSVNGLKE